MAKNNLLKHFATSALKRSASCAMAKNNLLKHFATSNSRFALQIAECPPLSITILKYLVESLRGILWPPTSTAKLRKLLFLRFG